jgi:diguanylate cyclase (GGDEF)-like protein/PAS domain S-box-containing protein
MATRNTRTPLGREKIKRPGWGARFLETNGRSNAGLRPGGEAPPRADEAAQRSETQFRGLTELSADWYWEQDQHYRFTFISNGFNEKTGRDPATYLGRTRWDEPALNLDGAQWDRHRAQLERRESFRDFEIQRIAPDGRAVWVSVSAEPIVAEGGAFTGYRGVGRDITAQKRTEELLRLEHAVARCLGHASTVSQGLQAALRAMCEMEGWDYGRYFRLDPASGQLKFQDGWFAREPAIEQFLERSRVRWQTGKAVWTSDLPRAAGMPGRPNGGGSFATFAFAAEAQGKTIGMLAFSGHNVREPDDKLLDASRAIGSLFGQFLQRKEAEESLRESEARFRALTHLSSDFFWETDAEHRISSIVHGPSYAAAQIGRGVIGKTPWDLPSLRPDQAGWTAHKAVLHGHLPFRDFEFARAMPNGGTRYFSVSGQPWFGADGNFLGYRGVGRDVTEIALARDRIASLAYSDPLTGLANRISLGPALDQAIERSRRHSTKLGGVFIDLDGFKQINDAHGHAAGDAFLVEVARRLCRSLRASDLVARLGGDEFFVVLEQVQDAAAAERVVAKMVAELLRPYDILGVRARISASLGVSIFPDDADDAATLMEHADKAMYSAKQAGKNAYCLFATGAMSGERLEAAK